MRSSALAYRSCLESVVKMRPSGAEGNQVLYIPLSSAVWSETGVSGGCVGATWLESLGAHGSSLAHSTLGQPQPANRDPGRKEKVPLMTTPQRISSNSTFRWTERFSVFLFLLLFCLFVFLLLLYRKAPSDGICRVQILSTRWRFKPMIVHTSSKAFTHSIMAKILIENKYNKEVKTNEQTNDPRSALTAFFYVFL